MTAPTQVSPRTAAPISPEEIARVRAPFRRATLLPARACHDQAATIDVSGAGRYANDGRRTIRGWRTETAGERRLAARVAGTHARGETPASGGRLAGTRRTAGSRGGPTR